MLIPSYASNEGHANRLKSGCATLRRLIKNPVFAIGEMDRSQRFFNTAILISALAHVLVIVGVRFTMPDPRRISAAEPIEIVLVNQKTETAPVKPQVLAQVNMDAGGNSEAKVRATSPLPAAQRDPVLERTLQQQKQLEAKAEKLMSQLKSDWTKSGPDKPVPEPSLNTGLDPEQLKQQSREIAAAAAQISKNYQAYQEKPRKSYVGVRAKGTSEAMWVDSWIQKIERVGTFAYPKDSAGNKLRGSLRVAVEINQDGSILASQIDKSSGNPQLDEAALRILRQAAPFSRLPPDLVDDSGRQATVLVIVRTWTFGRDGGLETSYR